MSVFSELKQASRIATESGFLDLLKAVWYLKIRRQPEEYISKVYCEELSQHVVLRRYTSDLYCLPHIVRELEYRHLGGLQSPKVIVDLGANVGYTTLWLKKQYPHSTIIAVEPSLSNFRLLQRNVELSGYTDIVTINAGVWDRDGHLSAVDADTSEMWTKQFVFCDHPSASTVPVITLQSLMLKHKLTYIDVLKVDIEGAERHLLADESIDWPSCVGVLAIETHLDPYYGDTGPLLLSLLAKYSHDVQHFSQTHTVTFRQEAHVG